MDDRIARLEAAVASLQDEVAELRSRITPDGDVRTAAPASALGPLDVNAVAVHSWIAMAGRTLVILGGAYLLRALTEARVLPAGTGVAIGLAYGAPWLLLASRAGRRGAQADAFCHGLATALIGFPLVWEATFRFGVLSPPQSAALLGMLTAGALVLAFARHLHSLAWIVVLGALASACSLAIATRAWPSYTVLVLGVGIATLWLGYTREWILLRWAPAVLLNVMLFITAGRAAVSGRSTEALLIQALVLGAYFGSFAVRTLLRGRRVIPFEVVQSIAVLVFAFGGAIYLIRVTGANVLPAGIATLGFGAIVYGVAFGFVSRRHDVTNFFFYSLLAMVLTIAGVALAFGLSVGSLVYGLLGIGAARLAASRRPALLRLQATVYVAAAIIASGLFTTASLAIAAPPAQWIRFDWAMFAAAAAGAIVMVGRVTHAGEGFLAVLPRVVLAALMTWVGLAMATVAGTWTWGGPSGIDDPTLSAVRTTVLVLATLLAERATRTQFAREVGWLTYPLLVATGLKILFVDFPGGRPATLFIALAMYGVALIVAARGGTLKTRAIS